MLIIGFFIGFIAQFIFARIGDKTCKIAAAECAYNCENCSCHCVGYHCHLMRENIIEQNINLNYVKTGEGIIDDSECI